MTVLRLGEVTSTQDVAKALAADGAPHGFVVRAETQTGGRGRLGRRWSSEPGEGLTFSVILRPSGPLREAPLLTLGAAAGLALALDVQVKWPNDLVVPGPPELEPDGPPRKLGGLLGELECEPGGAVRHVVLGVGLNVLQRQFSADLPFATSLRMAGAGVPTPPGVELDLDDVFERAVAAILAWHAHPRRLDLWRQRAHTLGRRVCIVAGADTVDGVAAGLADDGALLVQLSDGVVRAVHVGELVGVVGRAR